MFDLPSNFDRYLYLAGVEHINEKHRDRTPCRVMFTRKCPTSGCTDKPCARFEDDDESRWATEVAELERRLTNDISD